MERTTASSRRFFLVAFMQLALFGVFVSYMNVSTTAMNARALSSDQSDSRISKADINSLINKVDSVHPKPKNYDPPKLAWLLSFPNSGTSYTLKLISRLSHTYVATNYGDENKMDVRTSFPVYQDQSEVGPFWVNLTLYPNYTYPKEFVIVSTHCGGRCESCAPSQYAETTYSFRRACQRGTRRTVKNGTTTHSEVLYPTTRLVKAIHLIRNPFDNVVSRFSTGTKSGIGGIIFNKTKEGFREYCEGLNKIFLGEESKSILFDKEWLDLTQGIPCRADFFRWIEWHSQVFHLTNDMQLETMVLDYGSYNIESFNATCNRLLEFLNLKRHDDPEPFVDDEMYHNYFTADERKRMGIAIKQMSSQAAWQHVAKYFTN